MSKSCRFYEKKFPEQGEVVMVNVCSIADIGAYVKLLEYDGIDGMIILNELSRKRIRSVNKLIRIGRNDVAVVLRVDQDKMYIDLSKKRVDANDLEVCENKYYRAKQINNIIKSVAEECNIDMEELYRQTAWKFENSYEIFKQIAINPDEVFEKYFEIDSKVKDVLLSTIQKRLATEPLIIRANINVVCTGYAGVDAVKEVLHAGLINDVKIYTTKESYVLDYTTLNREKGIDIVNKSIEAIGQKTKLFPYTILDIIHPPHVINKISGGGLELEQFENTTNYKSGND